MKNRTNKIILLICILVFGLFVFYLSKQNEKTYTLKSYNPTTKETNVLQYVIKGGDTIIEGKSIYYSEQGKKIREYSYNDGQINGECIVYFNNNGKTKSKHYMKNSKTKMEAVWNYPNGNIERYILYDDFGMPNFTVSYDQQGNVKGHEGLPLIEIYQYKLANKKQFKIKTNQVLKVGDVLKYKYLLANIPNAQRNFKIKLLDSDNAQIKRKITKNPPVEIDVEEILTKKGKNAIKGIVEYKFNDTKKTIIKDSVYFEVNVN